MKRLLLLLTVPIVACTLPSLLFAIASVRQGWVGGTDKWPQGLRELANRESRVHGYFVNVEDILFYTGDTKAFNDFLAGYSKLEETVLQVVIHPGPWTAKSEWEKLDPEIHVDWSLYASPFVRELPLIREHIKAGKPAEEFFTRIDLFLGRNIGLEGLEVPANVEIRSGGEIEQFVDRYKEKRASLQKEK